MHPVMNHRDHLVPAARARMRGGILFTLAQKQLCDVTLYDLANGGTGVLLPRDQEVELPLSLVVKDDRELTYTICEVAFEHEQHVGLRPVSAPVLCSMFNFPTPMPHVAKAKAADVAPIEEEIEYSKAS